MASRPCRQQKRRATLWFWWWKDLLPPRSERHRAARHRAERAERTKRHKAARTERAAAQGKADRTGGAASTRQVPATTEPTAGLWWRMAANGNAPDRPGWPGPRFGLDCL